MGQCVSHHIISSLLVVGDQVVALGSEDPAHQALVAIIYLLQKKKGVKSVKTMTGRDLEPT